MPDALYERDALIWAETQAGLLRRLASGELVNEQIDWANVIEEVHDVGLSQLRACESLLLQALLHLLKAKAWPASRSAEHWDDEAETFLSDARRSYAPSMRQRLDLADLYREAVRRVRRKVDDTGEPAPLPDACPFDIDDLLASDIVAIKAKLAPITV